MPKICFTIFLFFIHSLSAKTLIINSKTLYQVNPYIQYTLAYELNETVHDLDNRHWENNKNKFNTLGNMNKAYWAKIHIKNISSAKKKYYFKSENQFTYHIQFFILKKNNLTTCIEDGVISKNRYRQFNTNHMIFPLLLEADEEIDVFFKIRNYNKIDINFSLVTKEYLLNFYQTYNMAEGIFFGSMLIMLFYNLFLYFLLHFRPYIYYVSYTFWLIVYFIGLFGFSQRYFADYTWIFYISSGAFFISLTLFVQSILNLHTQLPKVNKILNLFITYFVLTTLINIYVLEIKNFFYAQLLFNLFFILAPIFISIIVLSTYYLAYYKKDIIAKFYSFVWTILSFFGLLLPLVYLNVIKVDIHSDYIFQFLILFEVLSFSFILALKIKIIENEKKEQTQLLVQQNKLASMGEMISAIAHQWRQPLSEINGIILNMDLDYRQERLSSHVFNAHLDHLEMTTSYMSNTIHDFMDFFKKNKRPEFFSISNVIQESLKLLNISKDKNINIIHSITEDITILTYKSELIQAILIVLNNAIDASLKKSQENSKITIKTTSNGENLFLSIADNGEGIPLELLEKIYTPYFTTKHESKGTGLGLYILKMIIENNMKGHIKMISSLEGTECILIIPLKCE